MELKITEAESPKTLPDESSLGFGTIFTDHMMLMDFDQEKGWHNARVEPYQKLIMDPAAMVLHYSQTIFEGLKAYRTENGKIQLFRPKDNIKRLNTSARKMCIPEMDEDFLFESLKKLINLEERWVPREPGTSLYIRPTVIAVDPYVGLRSSNTYLFYIILSPVGAYYAEGFNPVKIWVSKDYVRAIRGGVGDAKTGGNYAASLKATEDANKNGYTQVLWLDGVEQKYIEEVGAMNIFFIIDDEIITPMLSGSILPGITRDSVISLAKKWGLKISERRISIDEIVEAHENGKLKEVFGSGTAAVISPVGEIKYGDKEMVIEGGKVGELSQKFMDSITDIQYGRVDDDMNWVVEI
ncbi:MAG: branched-chain amino acid aminotransferase [Deltaproteobacteria bacterium]|nr:branched-chain amino acid aminotransferase [Deltaproteobacteria bacterium]